MSEKKLANLSSKRNFDNNKNLSFKNIFIIVCLFILAGIFLSQISSSIYKTREKQLHSVQQQAEKTLSRIVTVAAGELNKINEIVDKVLQKQTNIEDLNEKYWQENLIAELSTQLGQSVSIDVLPEDYNPDEIIDDFEKGYVILSLLNDIRQQESVDAEVHPTANKQDSIVLVRKIISADQAAEDQIFGIIIFKISTQLFKNLAGHFDPELGYIEVVQKSSNKSLVLMRQGDESHKESSLMSIKKMPNSRWLFEFWPAMQTSQFPLTDYWKSAVYVIFGILSLFTALLLTNKIIKQYRHEKYTSLPERQISPFSRQSKTGAKKDNVQEVTDSALSTSNDAIPEMKDCASINRAINQIFKAYDVRGVVGEQITANVFKKIALGIAQEAQERNQTNIAVACDGRNSSPELVSALIDGLQQSGINVLDMGMVPTPVLYFAAISKCDGNGIMVTASHNPANYNGMKIMLAGHSYSEAELQALKERVLSVELKAAQGSIAKYNILEEYVTKITANIILARPLNIVIDTGNGVAGVIAQTLFEQLGCKVIPLFAEVDGDFPNHQPDPSRPENLTPLSKLVTEQKADIGFAFDGDGDRLGVVTSGGEIIWPDRVLMLLAKDILSRNKGATILYDVKSSKKLSRFISQHGGKSIMCPSGYSLMKKKLLETGAILAGEMSGHLFIKERWFGFDDALFAAARVLEILSIDLRKSRQVFAELPDSLNTPEILLPVENPHAVINSLMADTSAFSDAKLYTIDGVRAEYSRGWGLVRASNTTENLTLRFEADDEQSLQDIAQNFKQAVIKVAPEIEFPF